jgi:hypothetical protein
MVAEDLYRVNTCILQCPNMVKQTANVLPFSRKAGPMVAVLTGKVQIGICGPSYDYKRSMERYLKTRFAATARSGAPEL